MPETCLTRVESAAAVKMVNLSAEDVPPPGDGLTTLTRPDPAAVRSATGMMALNCVEATQVVVSGEPFHSTTAPSRKFEPEAIRLISKEPAFADVGEMEERVGT